MYTFPLESTTTPLQSYALAAVLLIVEKADAGAAKGADEGVYVGLEGIGVGANVTNGMPVTGMTTTLLPLPPHATYTFLVATLKNTCRVSQLLTLLTLIDGIVAGTVAAAKSKTYTMELVPALPPLLAT